MEAPPGSIETIRLGFGRRFAARLEVGGGAGEAIATAWPRATLARGIRRLDPRSPVRRVDLPSQGAVVGVGGATLGGSGRTPVAIAVAAALAARGFDVAFVGHGFGAHSRDVRRVFGRERIADVGDEALIAARLLPCPVFVGPRAEAIAMAARVAGIVIVDRLLQTRPRRVARALLVVDEARPWGAGAPPPLGDLVASRERLRAAADEVVAVPGPDVTEEIEIAGDGLRVGLVTSCARPPRVLRSLERRGIVPRVHVERGDHAPWSARDRQQVAAIGRARGVDRWLLDAKTSIAIDDAGDALEGAAAIGHRLVLSPALVDRVVRAADDARGDGSC